MPTETPAQALIRQAKAHRSRGARRLVTRHADEPLPDAQLEMFTDAEQTRENHR